MTETPHDVPARPDYVLRVRTRPDGTESAWLDAEEVTVPPGTGVHRALLRAARRRADREHPGRTIRVTGITQDDDVFHMAIDPDGNAWEVPPPDGAGGGMPPVPDETAHTIELLESAGTLTGLVDGDRVELVAGEDPYDQLLREARRRADQHAAGETVRVQGRTPDGRTWHTALAPDGTAHVVPPVSPTPRPEPSAPAPVNAFRPAEPEPQPAAAPPTVTRDEPPASGLTDDLGRPIPVTTTQASAHPAYNEAPVREPEPMPSTSPAEEAPDRRSGPSRRALLLGGAGVVALAGAGTVAFLATRGGSSPQPTPAPTGTPLPDGIRPPAGLPASYLWSVVNLSDVSPQVVVSDDRLVCTVDNDTTGGTQLVSLDANTGKALWKADIPVDAVLSGGPALCPIDGANAVVLTTETQIIAYPITGGEPKTWPLQTGWSVALTSSGVIVTKPSDKASAFVLHGDRLAQRALPGGGNPVALLPDGTLVVTDIHGQVWLVKDATKAGAAHRLEAPRGTTPGTFVAATATQLITAFVPRDDTKSSLLRSFSLPSLRPRITTAPVTPAVFPSNFMIAPDESWAVGSNAWIDLTTGDSHVITSRWSPIAISQHNSWSKSGSNVLTANARGKSLGPAKSTSGQVTVPCGGTAEVAYCVASVGSDTTLYAVPLPA